MLLGHFTLRAARKPPANYASEHATDIGEREDRLERGAYRDQDSDIERGRRDSERKAIRNVRVDDASRDPEGAEQAEHEAGDWAHPKSQAFRVRLRRGAIGRPEQDDKDHERKHPQDFRGDDSGSYSPDFDVHLSSPLARFGRRGDLGILRLF